MATAPTTQPGRIRRRSVPGHIAALIVVSVALLAACGSGPSADAGDDFTVTLGEAPVFDGCGSGGDGLSYTWTIVGAPTDMGDDVGKVLRQSIGDCSFTLESSMIVDDLGEWTIELLVTDSVTEDLDEVTVTVVEG